MRLFPFALALVLSAGLLPGQALRRAPGFTLPTPDGRLFDLADYRGKIVLLDLMKTDCPHCGPFARILEQAKTKYGDKVEVLSVVAIPDSADNVAAFISANKITFPILLDCGQMMFSYLRPNPARPVVEFPHLYIIGPTGMILRDYGYSPETQEIFTGQRLFQELDQILGSGASRRKPPKTK